MKLSKLLLFSPAVSVIASTTLRSTSRNLDKNLHDDVVTIDREVDEEGKIPIGRKIQEDPNHPIPFHAELGKSVVPPPPGDGGGNRNLAYPGTLEVCSPLCLWVPWYGYIAYCCEYDAPYVDPIPSTQTRDIGVGTGMCIDVDFDDDSDLVPEICFGYSVSLGSNWIISQSCAATYGSVGCFCTLENDCLGIDCSTVVPSAVMSICLDIDCYFAYC